MKNLIYIIQYYLYNSKNQIETQRLSEKWFNKNKLILEWEEYKNFFTNREKLYNFMVEKNLQHKEETPSTQYYNKCLCCQNETKFVGLKHGYKKYCSRNCAAKYTFNSDKLKETMFSKYGVENAFQLDSNRKACNSSEAIEKKKITFKHTCLERYGVDTVLRLKEFRNDHLRDYKNIVEKFIKTNMSKYGYPCTLNRPEYQKTRRMINENNGIWLPLSDYEDFKLYSYYVWKETNKQNLCSLNNYNLRGRSDLKENAHHLDHKFSIYMGFKNNIPTFIIGNICNLEMLHYKNNTSKGIKCSIEKEELISSFYNIS